MENKTPEFKEFKKIPRLSRECIVTEKIDGTNGVIYIENDIIYVGSKSRWLSEKEDNFGFYKWVMENRDDLLKLGQGYHYGEWWGQGIQRNYGLKEKKFSLFNVSKWSDPEVRPKCCDVVPVLAKDIDFDTEIIESYLYELKHFGSKAVPGFMKPEGIVIFHKPSSYLFKKTLENDKEPKGKYEKQTAS